MTDRDEFAKIAAGGLASGLRPGNDYSLAPIAKQAYDIADAMLIERASRSATPFLTNEERHALEIVAISGIANSSICTVIQKLLEREKGGAKNDGSR